MKSRENRKQYWQEQLNFFYTSGLTQREYCRTSNLSYWSFNQWKRRLENETPSLTEVRIKPENPETSSDNKIEISLNKSIRILLPVEMSPEVLIYIIKSLGDTTCR